MDPVPSAVVDGLSAAGRWLTGLCGIAAVLVCSYAISSYAAFQADPSKCLAQLAASDAIAVSRKLAATYLLSGVFALVASALPAWKRQLRILKPASAHAGGPAMAAASPPAGMLVMQAIASSVGLIGFCLATLLVWKLTGDVAAPGQLQAFNQTYQTECDARQASGSRQTP